MSLNPVIDLADQLEPIIRENRAASDEELARSIAGWLDDNGYLTRSECEPW